MPCISPCKCIYHENIDLVCTALANFSRSKQIQIDLKSFATADNLVKTTVCDIFDKNCVWRNCDNCSTNNIYKLFEPLQTFYNDQITIYQWERILLEKEGNSLKVTKKASQSKCIDEVINMLENQLQSFSIHQHTNIVQLHRFKHQKENLGDGEVIISEDFSENYSLKHQNEIMSAHWTQEQVSLFCATVHYSKDEVKKHQHYVLCSNDLGHDKDSIYFYNKYIIDNLREKEIPVKNVHYWSDGPSSQFKNQFLFTNLLFHEQDHQAKADWNFFATAHGKGENDGVGGDVKNAVWRKTLQQKEVVTSCEEFVSVAKKKFPYFVIAFFPKESVRSLTIFLSQRYQQHSKPLVGTMSFHHIEISNKRIVGHLLSPSCSCHQDENQVEKNTDIDNVPNVTIKPVLGKFYRVRYIFENEKGGTTLKVLPAMCERNDLEEHLFVFLKRASLNGFIYALTKTDKFWIHEDDIVEELATPELTRRGNQYKFSVEL